jgi:hypothetical protein
VADGGDRAVSVFAAAAHATSRTAGSDRKKDPNHQEFLFHTDSPCRLPQRGFSVEFFSAFWGNEDRRDADGEPPRYLVVGCYALM